MQRSEIEYDDVFKENYAKRITKDPDLTACYDKQFTLFMADRTDPKLKDHHLSWGMQGKRAFSITKDIRVVYKETDDVFLFLDIGTHGQVYK
jgi:mRNA-degrading endonuclease YafQ of YafQ-DinJ toxin-antitoxin module